jgi:hypothetical protein
MTTTTDKRLRDAGESRFIEPRTRGLQEYGALWSDRIYTLHKRRNDAQTTKEEN